MIAIIKKVIKICKIQKDILYKHIISNRYDINIDALNIDNLIKNNNFFLKGNY
ncbi:hypothetical protein PFAG_03460 [Plasmodium falciparum Santa Lucia]|uniref:Uncharacterized protein n=4 Tax=Plasmodium falciparum TaxID=5833 RepID=A0A024W6V5_PLAFA|nr:hypothetical protein PFTANZ_03474 [Plasmodium falciparum Tanzania (2000708)]EUR70303.1 hypothetical protein PFBG_03530 [Plasmodium falciparum 7G8]EUT83585.1 hypothetical protein PFAG_03460 [Plasmodium falciparum Santa Lucia]EWC75838.1 hypothetical protein C923_03547 [Plasmodium falciparum UGT5.1]